VIGVNEFQMHLRWLAEQRRLADLERRYQQAERIVLREIWASSDEEDNESDDEWEVIDNDEQN
jgi:hypothetical protein